MIEIKDKCNDGLSVDDIEFKGNALPRAVYRRAEDIDQRIEDAKSNMSFRKANFIKKQSKFYKKLLYASNIVFCTALFLFLGNRLKKGVLNK